MKVVVVGFKVSEENSVYYKKVDVGPWPEKAEAMTDEGRESLIGKTLLAAANKGADFVSVRFVRTEKP